MKAFFYAVALAYAGIGGFACVQLLQPSSLPVWWLHCAMGLSGAAANIWCARI